MPKTDKAPAPKTQKPKAKSTDVAVLNKKDVLTTVVDMTKVSPKDAKAVVDAMLVVMGQALIEGKALALPPLGRLRVQKKQDQKGAEVFVLRLRRPAAAEALAQPDS